MPPTGALKPDADRARQGSGSIEGADWPDALAGDVAPAPPDAGSESADRGDSRRRPQRVALARRLPTRRRSIVAARAARGPLMWAALERDGRCCARAAGGRCGSQRAQRCRRHRTDVRHSRSRRSRRNCSSAAPTRTSKRSTAARRSCVAAGHSRHERPGESRLLDAGADVKAKGASLFGQVSALTEAAVGGGLGHDSAAAARRRRRCRRWPGADVFRECGPTAPPCEEPAARGLAAAARRRSGHRADATPATTAATWLRLLDRAGRRQRARLGRPDAADARREHRLACRSTPCRR